MVLELPAGFVWRDQGRLAWCNCCSLVVPCSSEKLLKQHLKSKTHKQASSNLNTSDLLSTGQPAAQQALSSCIVAPEDYQAYHLEALHVAGSYPQGYPYAGLYHTLESTFWEDISKAAGYEQVSNNQLEAIEPAAPDAGHTSSQLERQEAPQPCGSPLRQQPSSDRISPELEVDDVQVLQQLRGWHLNGKADSCTCNRDSSQLQQPGQHGCAGSPIVAQPRQQNCGSRPCWPPPFALKPKAALAAGLPFVTLLCGSIPWVPDDVEEALAYYCQPGACRLPNIDIAGVNQQVKSWSHAAKLLRAAAAGTQLSSAPACHNDPIAAAAAAANLEHRAHVHGAAAHQQQVKQQSQYQQGRQQQVSVPFWASLVADISHPSWWPKTGHVPTYDNVIIGAGSSGIGIHRDVDHSVRDNPPPVSTYLTIVRGKKHVILMPPDQTLFPVDDKAPFPVQPTPELLHAIKAAGGAYFDLQPASDGSPVTLYMPAGWLHWLMGASGWHVVFGGSMYSRGLPGLR